MAIDIVTPVTGSIETDSENPLCVFRDKNNFSEIADTEAPVSSKAEVVIPKMLIGISGR